ncbi:MAG: DUF11 domain-containing protein [Nostocales cyanobacterium]|nr:MAG: DUF11 domain-containing protein [Nostocales cyanobacterium]
MNKNQTNKKSFPKLQYSKILATSTAICLAILTGGIQSAQAEGSRNLYPTSSPANARRANLEWRNELSGNLIRRRTLLKVYANAGEYILMGSSAVGINNGDIYVYNPGLVTGQVGSESFPATPTFQCTSQTGTGWISSRTQELAGPQNITGTGNTTGYVPCYYQAPTTGVYDVVVFGPAGFNVSGDGSVTNEINLTSATNFDSTQGSSVAAWDVTVRSDTNSTTDLTGRLFAYYLTLFTGNGARPIYVTVYPVTNDGYIYRSEIRGLDPNGFILYGNEVGFFDSDGQSTLYHNIVGTDGNVSNPQGGTQLSRPQFPTFFNQPNIIALGSVNRYDRSGNSSGVGITTIPTIPEVKNASFTGSLFGNTSKFGNGGTFTFDSTVAGTYEIVIKGSGSTDFDPTNPKNRVLRNYMDTSGLKNVAWDGKDNAGNLFPVGSDYEYNIRVRAGEYHFPVLDGENNASGGPTVTLLNPPVGYPGDLPGFGVTTGFYDDRVYKTKGGVIVYIGATQTDIDNNSPLCGTNPPTIPFSNQITGFDTTTNQRAFGANDGSGNTNIVCTGSFGDTKGLDQWTFFPSVAATGNLNILTFSPKLVLVKRITAINNVPINTVVDGRSDVPNTASNYVAAPNDVDDNDPKWPAGYLKGQINAGVVKPGDEIEYTIYFLSNGAVNAQNVKLCDLVPENTTFLPTAFNTLTPNDGVNGADQGIALAVANTAPTVYFSNLPDSDRGSFYLAGDATTPTYCPSSNTNGAVVIQVNNAGLPFLPYATGSGTPANSYGFIRFKARVK